MNNARCAVLGALSHSSFMDLLGMISLGSPQGEEGKETMAICFSCVRSVPLDNPVAETRFPCL
jgi:hypothetical protein